MSFLTFDESTHTYRFNGKDVMTTKHTPEATADVAQILKDRGAIYGKFTGHADVTQRLKVAIRSHLKKRQKMLADDQQEALEMICHKIGRILNGDPNYADSWVDIAGYAKLVADRLQGVER